jgi:hypothetical protein
MDDIDHFRSYKSSKKPSELKSIFVTHFLRRSNSSKLAI